MNEQDKKFMLLATAQAKLALKSEDVPIGAVLVKNREILAKAFNQREALSDPTAHAEVLLLREAAKKINNWYLDGTTLYVTVEPCLMCLGACLLARVKRVVYGCDNPKGGAAGKLSKEELKKLGINHSLKIESGVLAEECALLLKDFFASKR